MPAQPWRSRRCATPRRDFPGRDAELDVVPRRELGEKLGRALEQRLAVGRVGAQALEGGLVALGKALGRAVGGEHAERLEKRQPDDRERALAARRLEAVRPEGRALRCDNQILAVDERTVDVEHDELQRGFSGSEIGHHYLAPRPRRRQRAPLPGHPGSPPGLYAQSQKDFSDGRRPK
jgi:hypothetical protein